jgi:hypothetical protein
MGGLLKRYSVFFLSYKTSQDLRKGLFPKKLKIKNGGKECQGRGSLPASDRV